MSFRHRALFAYAFLALTAAHAHAQGDYFYLMGGGGEADGPSTMFDGNLSDIGAFVSHSDWATTVSFDGGHSKTRKILDEKLPKAQNIGPFSMDSYNRIVEEIRMKITSGEIASGSQVMIYIDSHGAISFGEQSTHSIAAEGVANNLNNLSGTTLVSLDTLKGVLDLAKQKAVKLAVIDESCFSGNTQALANDSACIISATGPHQFSYGSTSSHFNSSFSDSLSDSLKTGKNLEELYLSSRKDSALNADFPMISTPEGQAVQKKLYALLDPYLQYDSNEGKQFSGRYSVKTLSDNRCESNQNFSDLQTLLADLKKGFDGESVDTSRLKSALQKYRDYQLKYEDRLVHAQAASDEIKSLIESGYPTQKNLFMGEDGVSAYCANYDSSHYKKLYDGASDDYGREVWKSEVDSIEAKKAIIADVGKKLSKDSKRAIDDYQDALGDAMKKTRDLAGDVSRELRVVYDKMYHLEMKSSSQSNPCRDFVL